MSVRVQGASRKTGAAECNGCKSLPVGREPRVISPIETLFQRQGVSVALVSVEFWDEETIVRLAALPENPRAADREFHASLDRWAAEGRQGSPPDEPGEAILDVRVSLTDDAGTKYPLRSSAVGGTGRLFRGDWYFIAGVPENAQSIVVDVEGDGVQVASTAIDLRRL